MNTKDIKRFSDLTFEDFKKLAKDESLSKYQKIGFPNSYREGKEEAILQDILEKNPILHENGKKILDIGPGCSGLIHMFIDFCAQKNHQLILIDSQEMLDLLPDNDFITKIPGLFPADHEEFLSINAGSIDCIITYSVFHYIFTEGNIYDFVDKSASLLKSNGSLFIGDIPNVSKRQRFFATEAGVKYHQEYTQTDTLPPPFEYKIQHYKIDDGLLLGLVNRYRNFGFEAYLLPQGTTLPMSNRREDLLIYKF